MKSKEFEGKNYYLFDAKEEILGRMSTGIARILMGKNSINYRPNQKSSNWVIVINSDLVRLSGEKAKAKKYWTYTGYPGGIKNKNFEEKIKADSKEVIMKAVKGMMPKNKLTKENLKQLRIFHDSNHNYKKIFKEN